MRQTKHARYVLLVGGLAASALLTAASPTTAGKSRAAVELRSALASLGHPAATCKTQCEYTSCTGDNHKNQTHSQGTNGGEGHACAFSEGGCLDHACGEAFNGVPVDLSRLAALIESVTGDELQVLDAESDRLEINAQRRAAQLISCGSQVALSVNLSVEQVDDMGLK